MVETLIEYRIRLPGRDGRTYGARACGREREDGLWEAWLEFVPEDGGEPVRSGRETTQPNRAILYFWATGLSDTYLDGALLRTLRQLPGAAPPRESPLPGYEEVVDRPLPDGPYAPFAILDPFRVYAAGSDMLRNQLNALGNDHLIGIVKAYRLSDDSPAVIDGMSRQELIELIMKAVVTAAPGAPERTRVPR